MSETGYREIIKSPVDPTGEQLEQFGPFFARGAVLDYPVGSLRASQAEWRQIQEEAIGPEQPQQQGEQQ